MLYTLYGALEWGQLHERKGPAEEIVMQTSFTPRSAPGGH